MPKDTLTLEDCLKRIEDCRTCDCKAGVAALSPELLIGCRVEAGYCDDGNEFADTDSAALLQLADGRWATFSEWGDSSGHG